MYYLRWLFTIVEILLICRCDYLFEPSSHTMANPAKIEQFIAVTGVSEDQAKFYLDSSSGDLETAVEQFYATGGAQDVPAASDDEAMEELFPEIHAGSSRCLCPHGTCSLHNDCF